MGIATRSPWFPVPVTLNFAIIGRLTFGQGISCPNMRIGQGYTFPWNNWWVGGENCSRENDSLICLCDEGRAIMISPQAFTSNLFEVLEFFPPLEVLEAGHETLLV